MTISSNTYLTLEEMTPNAQYILDHLLAVGWSKNAVCGVLGNMQTESTINPGLWESMDYGNMSGGFGLVQWTPATNYTDWANSNGYAGDWGNIDGQIARISYEATHNDIVGQWIPTPSYPMSFDEFIHSTDNAGTLALAFIANYERPYNPNQPIRADQANYWFNTLSGTGGGTTPTPKKKKMALYMYKLF